MAGNDVRVRLTPEGVREVQNALRTVQRDADRTSRRAAGGIRDLTRSLGGMRRILGALGVTVSAVGFLALARNAMQAADEMGKAAERVGTTSERYSVFAFRARRADVSNEILRVGLSQLARNMIELERGTTRQVDAFAQLGLTAEDLAGLDTAQAFELISSRMAEMEAGARKTAVSMDLFGRSGSQLIPLMNDLGERGFAEVSAEAEKFGGIVTAEMAAAAAASQDSMELIRQQTEGLALQFTAGFAPFIAEAMASFTESTAGDGVDSMRKFGATTGRTLRGIVATFMWFGRLVMNILTTVGENFAAIAAAATLAFRGDFRGAGRVLQQGWRDNMANLEKITADSVAGLSDIMDAFTSEPREIEVRTRVTGGDDAPESDAQRRRAEQQARAALNARRQGLQDERALLEAHLATESAQNERAFRDGLVSLDQYMARRRSIIEQSAQAEIAALQDQLEALQQTPGLDAGEVERQSARIQTQLQVRQIELAQELDELAADRLSRERQAAQERLSAEQTILEAEGRRQEAAQIALQLQVQALRETMQASGATADEIDRAAERLQRAARIRLNFSEITDQAQADLERLSQARTRIEQDVALGITTQSRGQQRILELEQARLPILQRLAEESRAAADELGDPALVQQAEALTLQVRDLAVSVEQAGQGFSTFRDMAMDSAVDQFSSWLSDGVTQAATLKDAFKDLARSIINDLKRIAAQQLATNLAQGVAGAFGGGGAGSAAGAAVAAATGGLLSGPGTGTSDSILARVSDGEFIVRSAAVKSPGILPLLQHINSLKKLPKFSTGGLASAGSSGLASASLSDAGAGGGMFQGRLDVGLDEGLRGRMTETRRDERFIVDVIRKKQREVSNIVR